MYGTDTYKFIVVMIFMQKYLIIIPAHNEEENIYRTIRLILDTKLPVDILLVDDASTDNTLKIAKSFGIKIISYKKNGGKTKAFLAGAKYAISHKYLSVCCLDSDLIYFDSLELSKLIYFSYNSTIKNECAMYTISDYIEGPKKCKLHITGVKAFSIPFLKKFLKYNLIDRASGFAIDMLYNSFCYLGFGKCYIINSKFYGLPAMQDRKNRLNNVDLRYPDIDKFLDVLCIYYNLNKKLFWKCVNNCKFYIYKNNLDYLDFWKNKFNKLGLKLTFNKIKYESKYIDINYVLRSNTPFLATPYLDQLYLNLKKVKKIVQKLSNKYKSDFIGLIIFGSTFKGSYSLDSDLDFRLIGKNKQILSDFREFANNEKLILDSYSKSFLNPYDKYESKENFGVLYYGLFFGNYNKLINAQKHILSEINDSQWDIIRDRYIKNCIIYDKRGILKLSKLDLMNINKCLKLKVYPNLKKMKQIFKLT